MIYIVEVPHQRPASCWVASDEADFCAGMVEAYRRCGDTPEDGTFADWVEYLASDLNTLHVFVTDAEAVVALEDTTFDHHQGARARTALEEKLRAFGVLPEGSDDE